MKLWDDAALNCVLFNYSSCRAPLPVFSRILVVSQCNVWYTYLVDKEFSVFAVSLSRQSQMHCPEVSGDKPVITAIPTRDSFSLLRVISLGVLVTSVGRGT